MSTSQLPFSPKILFASNDDIALEVLKTLNPYGVLTTKEHSSGRKKRINPIKEWAILNNKKLYEVEHILKEEREEIQKENFDVLISFSFSKIFGPKFLAIFPQGTFNIHPSSLPKYRGPSPLQSAIINGDKNLDVVLQTISSKMDEGDIVFSTAVKIDNDDNYKTLKDKVSNKAITLINEFKDNYPYFNYTKQSGEPSYTHLIDKNEGIIDFSNNGEILERKIRAYYIFPRMRCFFYGRILFILKAKFKSEIHNEQLGKVISFDKINGLKVAVKDGYLFIERLQLEGKKEVDSNSFVNGYKEVIGAVLEGKS